MAEDISDDEEAPPELPPIPFPQTFDAAGWMILGALILGLISALVLVVSYGDEGGPLLGALIIQDHGSDTAGLVFGWAGIVIAGMLLQAGLIGVAVRSTLRRR